MAHTIVGLHIEEAVHVAVNESQDSDDALLKALRDGAEDAYETLIRRYQQPVYNLVYRLMSDPSDAPDVAQEVFLKVFRNIRKFRGNSTLKTWIYRIAVNESYNHRRWFSRHQRLEVSLTRDENTRIYENTFADPGRSPFDLTSDRETRALVEAAIAKMNPNFRAAVVLRDIEDLNYDEIAAVLDVSLGTVKSRILRGREALRNILEGRLEPETSLHWSTQPVVSE